MRINSNRKFLACGELVIALCLCAAFAAPGRADTVSAPFFALNCNGAQSWAEGQLSCAGGSVSSSGSPYAVVTSNFAGIGYEGGDDTGGTAQLTYYVVVSGGNPGDAVPVDVAANLSTKALGDTGYDVMDASASITLNFANGTSGDFASAECANVLRGGDCSNNQWSGTLHATAWVGYDNTVTLMASTTLAGAGFAEADADPHVYIDPTFAAANPQYSLLLNVSNDLPSSVAPEPASWLLAILPLGILAGCVGVAAAEPAPRLFLSRVRRYRIPPVRRFD